MKLPSEIYFSLTRNEHTGNICMLGDFHVNEGMVFGAKPSAYDEWTRAINNGMSVRAFHIVMSDVDNKPERIVDITEAFHAMRDEIM